MKQKTRWHDALVLAAVLCAAFLIVTGTQQITGRIDGVASMVFVLAVFDLDLYGWLCVGRGGFPDRRAGREFCVPLTFTLPSTSLCRKTCSRAWRCWWCPL